MNQIRGEGRGRDAGYSEKKKKVRVTPRPSASTTDRAGGPLGAGPRRLAVAFWSFECSRACIWIYMVLIKWKNTEGMTFFEYSNLP